MHQFFLQVQSKASTLSSGARAAAQILNVPIERLEAQVHSSSSGKPSPTNPNQIEKSHRHHNDEIIPERLEHHGKSHGQSHAYQQEHLSKSQHHVSQTAGNSHHKNGFVNGNSNHNSPHFLDHQNDAIHHLDRLTDSAHYQDENEEHVSSLTASPANMKYSLLQFALQHFRDE